MNVFGATTAHILDIDYLSERNREFFDFKPSLNGWHTSVNTWVSSAGALREADSFLKHVEAQVKELFPSMVDRFTVETGSVRRSNGVVCHEQMLMGCINGQWEVFAKVDIAYGPEDAIDAWGMAEEREWFHHSMV